MPFTGFKGLVYPEYDVITPQTLQTFSVRTLTVAEEERLKGSLKVPSRLVDLLNRAIWDCIIKKPDAVKNFNDFLKKVTLKDRDALLYGLYHISYEEIRNYDVECSSCARTYSVTIKASDTFNIVPFPKKAGNILDKKIEKELPVTKSVSVVVRQPVLQDEIDVLGLFLDSQETGVLTETLVIEKLTEQVEENKVVYEHREDIVDAYRSLPSKDRKFIFNIYMEEFGKYGIDLKMRATCNKPDCGYSEVIDVDLSTQFFRMAYSV